MDSSISPTDLATAHYSSDLLTSGLLALQQQQYQEAIGILEAFCHDCAAKAQLNSRDYLRAQMHLVTTYDQQGQPERALSLCHNLAQSSNAQVKIWAEQKLKTIDLAPGQTQANQSFLPLLKRFLRPVAN